MSQNEASARLKINSLLQESAWRLTDTDLGRANVAVETYVSISERLGETFARLKGGFADYILHDDQQFPLCVIEAKAENINPLVGKEQARSYATSQHCRFVILSNGNQHFLWDLDLGNPRIIQTFPTLAELKAFDEFKPTSSNLVNELIGDDYIVRTQMPNYASDPRWQDESQRPGFIEENKLRFLRKYQIRALERIQEEIKKHGSDRFLFEMATGTGKTLTAAAVIKMFLRCGNARRVLFLVDRIELEEQADKAFREYLKNDYQCVVYKKTRGDWNKAEIVVSTIQTFLANNRYKRSFRPNDFQLVISDEAHRSIGGNSRAVFEYFIGYKLGLTATPKDYLKNVNVAKATENDPRELERRLLLDTYRTFGCETGEPTFRYSLIDGVKDGYLVNPVVVDARTEITTQLLSDEGYSIAAVAAPEDEKTSEEIIEETFKVRDFERKFFSEETNRILCRTFLDHALKDPITGEIGKTIAFCVSQHHAAKITQILNELAHELFPGKYNSDFAMQVTSNVANSQQATTNFTNNNLGGTGNFDERYKTGKTRVCVTVGMMTTGYDCPDILNLCMMRPIFSPTDFVQIKGRGTRKHNFTSNVIDRELKEELGELQKEHFKLFDFFANCEYFEEKFNYDEVLKLPKPGEPRPEAPPQPPAVPIADYENFNPDPLKTLEEMAVGPDGMKIDRRLFERFEERVKSDDEIKRMVEGRDFDAIESYIVGNLFDKPEEFYNLDKLRKSLKIDRRLSLREIVEKIFGFVDKFKSKDELLEEEFDRFDSRFLPDETVFGEAKNFFKTYLTDAEFREIVESGQFPRLHTHPNGKAFFALPAELRKQMTEYIKDNVTLNKFMN